MKESIINKFLHFCEEGNEEGIKACLEHIDVDSSDPDGNTALHITCSKDFVECVRLLIASGATLDFKNVSGDTPLHLALSSGNLRSAILLLRSGADFDALNGESDSPIHIAAREGFTNIIPMLCAFGCTLNSPNNKGLYPIHLAARNGHIEIIRYLCLFGCNTEQQNFNGIKPEIMAFKNGHFTAGYLLNKLNLKHYRETYISQLNPTNKLLPKYNVKFVGCSGTGKTTLIRSLKAGYFSNWFSRTKFLNGSSKDFDGALRQSSSRAGRYEKTQGIEINQATFACGDVNLWDFSGLETYYSIYDYFLEDTFSLYVLVFNLDDPPSKQQYQCSFWLMFLQSRIPNPKPHSIRILLVGTHADVSKIYRDVQGVYISESVQQMRNRLTEEFPKFVFEWKVILCDAHASSSQAIKDIKNVIAETKIALLQNAVKSTPFLESTVRWLKIWRKQLEAFPVVTCIEFLNKVHRNVNPLAAADHITKLINQLTIMSEIYFVKSKPSANDLVVLDLNWLCSDIVGALLSVNTIAKTRMTGCYTEEDFQTSFPHGPADKMLDLLSALQICTKCECDEEVEFEFPCYNLVEKLDGLWTANDDRYSPTSSCYGGVRLKAPYKMLQTVFTRLQVQLRRATVLCQNPDSDLYQWFQGSKLCLGDIESFITLNDDGQSIDIKVRGTNTLRLNCFYFLDEILNIINQALMFITPGLLYEKYILSSKELKAHSEDPHCWSSEHIFFALSSSSGVHSMLRNPNTGEDESILELIGFGCENVPDNVVFGNEISIKDLPGGGLQALAQLLDPKDPYGKDWCVLAVKLGLGQKIATLDNECVVSRTVALLKLWGKSKTATVGNLVKVLIELGREDAAKTVMLYAPMYKIPDRQNQHSVY